MATARIVPRGQNLARPARVIDAERLKGARDTVTEVKADQEHRHHVQRHRYRVAEELHLEAIQVPDSRLADLVQFAELELLQVDDDKGQRHEAGPDHRRRRNRLAARVARHPLHLVALRASPAIVDVHLHGLEDVQHEYGRQSDLDRDDQGTREQKV